jgi:hypothetical protein
VSAAWGGRATGPAAGPAAGPAGLAGNATSGRGVWGPDLRGLLGIAAAGLLFAALAGTGYAFHPLVVLLFVVAAATAAILPATPAPTAVCVLAVFLLLSADVGFTGWVVVVASLLHTVHVLAGLGEVIPIRSRVEVAALAPSIRRWARTQALTLPVLIVLVAVLS